MGEQLRIAVVDDDPDDRELVQEALESTGRPSVLEFFEDGQQLLDRLKELAEGGGSDTGFPDLILLDLNMPRVDGRTALARIKEDARLRHIPVVVLTTSRSEEDIKDCYELGANSFMTKPTRFEELLSAMEKMEEYWVQVVRLPPRTPS